MISEKLIHSCDKIIIWRQQKAFGWISLAKSVLIGVMGRRQLAQNKELRDSQKTKHDKYSLATHRFRGLKKLAKMSTNETPAQPTRLEETKRCKRQKVQDET